MVGNGPFQTYGQREVVQLLHRADFDTKGEKSSFAAVCLKDRIAIQLITYCQFGYDRLKNSALVLLTSVTTSIPKNWCIKYLTLHL